MLPRKALQRLVPTALLAASLSCGGGEPRYAVGGQVTYDGQPVERGSIGFAPIDPAVGCPAGGPIANGAYLIRSHEGPCAGEYRVIIYAERSTGRSYPADEGSSETIEQFVQYLPPTYNDQTTLTVRLDADRDDLHFILERPSRRRR